MTRVEPASPRCAAFVDGQNLFHAAKEAFGYKYPNYNPQELALAICSQKAWQLTSTHFYTGIPKREDSEFWSHFWTFKLAALGRSGVQTYSRPLRYRLESVTLNNGTVTGVPVGREKGIDVRIALDVVRLARVGAFDVALIFSQDQDLSEAADEVRRMSIDQNRWLKVACAFPSSPTTTNRRGITGSDWIPVDRRLYDSCIDPNDYRPKKR